MPVQGLLAEPTEQAIALELEALERAEILRISIRLANATKKMAKAIADRKEYRALLEDVRQDVKALRRYSH